MRRLVRHCVTAALGGMLASAVASAQDGRPLGATPWSPPRFVEAQPLAVSPEPSAPPATQPTPAFADPARGGAPRPPAPFRLLAAEEPAEALAGPAGRRLAPRSASADRAGLAPPAAPSPQRALGTVIGGLGIVLGLFAIVVWSTRRFAPPGTAALPKEAVELLGRVPLAGRQQLQLLRVGGKLLLVAISPGGVETLTEISAPAEVEHLLALCRRGQPDSATAAFQQALRDLESEPARAGFTGAPRPSARGAS